MNGRTTDSVISVSAVALAGRLGTIPVGECGCAFLPTRGKPPSERFAVQYAQAHQFRSAGAVVITPFAFEVSF